MASKPLDLVRSIQAAWERGDFSSADWAHPEIEYEIVEGPSPGRWTGLAGMAAAFGDILQAWEHWRVEADQYRELDEERVLVLQHFAARGKASGLDTGPLATEVASVFEVRDGKVTRLVQYWGWELAFAELGLDQSS
ncbi:MAG: nuclear transport factor 2 family protein [Thermoleophilaceae bacterium]